MRTLIIEDEKAAVRNLIALLEDAYPSIEIIDTLDSIIDTLEWFKVNEMPELIFMDIHLADGSVFEIFEHIEITSPIIFTTAYDEYALRAFKVNSIDYLLKPIGKNDIENALRKFQQLTFNTEQNNTTATTDHTELVRLLQQIKRTESYTTHFLIPAKGDKLLPVSINDIHLFYIIEGQVRMVLKDGTEHFITQTLDELTDNLNPALFFRVNRQFLLSRETIKDISLWFNSRLSINLIHPVNHEKILVSKTRVPDFKNWFSHKV